MSEEKESSLKLPPLVVEPDNEYPSWSSKSQAVFEDLDLWEYVCGDKTKSPIVPDKIATTESVSQDQDGNQVITKVPGNEEEVEKKEKEVNEWKKKNARAKRLIFIAVPADNYPLVDGCKTAAKAWTNLQQAFMPANAERADELKRKIYGSGCGVDTDVVKWANQIFKDFSKLIRISPNSMKETEFYPLLTHMLPPTSFWVERTANLREKIERFKEKHKIHPTALTVINWIKEYDHMLDDLRDAEKAKNGSSNTNIFSAQMAGPTKRRFDDSQLPNPAKRNKQDNHNDGNRNPGLRCSNQYCNKAGHTIERCLAYGGGKAGQYEDFWTGPWNLHIMPGQRNKSNNIPPKNHIFYPVWQAQQERNGRSSQASNSGAIVNLSLSERLGNSRGHYPPESVSNEFNIASLEVSSGIVYRKDVPAGEAGNDQLENLHCNASALNPHNSVSQDCIYDSAANRHVFNSQTAFSTYEEIEPVKVRGFGKDLTSCAVGVGTVVVEGWKDGREKERFSIENVLHIPSARFNLVSQSQLDKAGISAEVGNGKVTLHKKGAVLLHGRLDNSGMYKLNMTPTRQTSVLNKQLVQLLSTLTIEGPQPTKLEDFTIACLGT